AARAGSAHPMRPELSGTMPPRVQVDPPSEVDTNQHLLAPVFEALPKNPVTMFLEFLGFAAMVGSRWVRDAGNAALSSVFVPNCTWTGSSVKAEVSVSTSIARERRTVGTARIDVLLKSGSRVRRRSGWLTRAGCQPGINPISRGSGAIDLLDEGVDAPSPPQRLFGVAASLGGPLGGQERPRAP